MEATPPIPPEIPSVERTALRELGRRLADAAESPRNRECVARWRAHDAAGADRPLVLAEIGGDLAMVEPDFRPVCQHPWAREAENGIRRDLANFGTVGDDCPLEPRLVVNRSCRFSDYGFGPLHQTGGGDADGAAGKGAFHIEPWMRNFPADLDRLRPRRFAVDRAGDEARRAELARVFDGLLDVDFGGLPLWSFGLTQIAVRFLGIEGFWLAMYDEPEGLHRLMAYIRDDHLAILDWLEREGLLGLNNRNDYIGSGSRGYTARLPRPETLAGGAIGPPDLWGLLESQETVGVSPEQYAEFVFPHENALARRFGAVYYGCCEPVHGRWEVLRGMDNLRRASVSPWCDEAFCAEAFGREIVYSRKPNPTLVSTGRFDEDAIRIDLLHTLELTKRHGCRTEIIMKDVHTLAGEPDRLARWTRLARESIDKAYG